MYKRKIASAILIIIIIVINIKISGDWQSDRLKMQEELKNSESLLVDANNEIKVVKDSLNSQIEQNESLIAELDALRSEFESLKEEHEALKEEYNECKALIDFVDRDAPANQIMKTYMDYRAIKTTSSQQYKLQQNLAYTGEYGLRMVNGRYCVALGSYYTKTIGQYVDIELENGIIIHGILADQKSDEHTDELHQMHPDGSVVEFVVDGDVFDPALIKYSGDISYFNGWDSPVVNIRVYDTIVDIE